MTRPRP